MAEQLYTGTDYSQEIANQYDAKRDAQLNNIRLALLNQVTGIEQQISALPAAYQPLRDDSEVNRYKASQALRENLANTGNALSGSGRQDTYRLHAGYNKQLTGINLEQQQKLDALRKAIADAQAQAALDEAQAGADSAFEKEEALRQEKNRVEEIEREEAWKRQQQAYERSVQEMDRAMERWRIMGVVSGQDAAILGVPEGSTTAEYAYAPSNQKLNDYKANLNASSSPSTAASGSGGQSIPAQSAAGAGIQRVDSDTSQYASAAHRLDSTISNANGNGWVYVEGLGRLSDRALDTALSARIVEYRRLSDGTYLYERA